jgi:integrase
MTVLTDLFKQLLEAVKGSPGLPVATSLDQAVVDFLWAKSRGDRSYQHIKRLRVTLRNFLKGHSGRPVSQITSMEIEAWIGTNDWAPKTARNYLTDLSIFFNWCIRRSLLERNPVLGVEISFHRSTKPIEVHTPDQVRTILQTAARADLDVCRHLAIRYFTGVRTSEAHLIRESHIKLDQDLIEVPAANAKTRARRLITIQPNLRAWLALGGEMRAIGDMTVRRVIKLSGVPWPSNVTRHSFVSYHLALTQSASKTALEAGHTEQMLFTHYRAVVTPQAAAEYWAIKPA